MLLTLTNKSVQCDIHTTCEIGKNGKQYLNIVRVCLHFVQQKYMIIITTAIHTIIIITCTTYSIAEISFKSSKISSSFGKFIVNSGEYVLPISSHEALVHDVDSSATRKSKEAPIAGCALGINSGDLEGTLKLLHQIQEHQQVEVRNVCIVIKLYFYYV